MKIAALRRLLSQEDLNFLLCNRIPRRMCTLFIGWFSQLRHPWVVRASIAGWQLFTDLDLSDARQRSFPTLHECFIRQLVDGARIVDFDPGVLTSPCDAIVGECGRVDGTTVFQAKGFPYPIEALFGASQDISAFRDGTYVTLRLTSNMYHRFHAPHDCEVDHVTYISGDTWNVNPIALRRIERLFCRNERAVLRLRLARSGYPVALVPVAAILVASIRLHFLDVLFHLRYRGEHEIGCSAAFSKAEEIGYFQHGSTILVFAPRGFDLCAGVEPGRHIRMGQPLLRLPQGAEEAFARPTPLAVRSL